MTTRARIIDAVRNAEHTHYEASYRSHPNLPDERDFVETVADEILAALHLTEPTTDGQLELPWDTQITPTPAMADGRSRLTMCANCGLLAAIPDTGPLQSHRPPRPMPTLHRDHLVDPGLPERRPVRRLGGRIVSGPRLPGIGSHHSANPQTDEWLPEIFAALGRFDLDPCSPTTGPSPSSTAAKHLTALDDGLTAPWEGSVWCNPPYSDIAPWMAKMAAHGNGIALVFARTETAWWFDSVWPHASRLLFLKGRLTFWRPYDPMAETDDERHEGTPQVTALPSKSGHNAGGPSVLIAYGRMCAAKLDLSGLPGALIATAGVTA